VVGTEEVERIRLPGNQEAGYQGTGISGKVEDKKSINLMP
jgi:hypothetical protein